MDFQIKNNEFLKNGKPIKIISGAVHYFRNMPDTWDDIFKKIKALGCNCVETYCAWNMHEKIQGQYDFSGNLDIAAFIRMAQKEDLMVIVRPGPYICAEWEFGGLPWWIMANDDMEIRCMNKQYIQCFEDYLDKLFEEIYLKEDPKTSNQKFYYWYRSRNAFLILENLLIRFSSKFKDNDFLPNNPYYLLNQTKYEIYLLIINSYMMLLNVENYEQFKLDSIKHIKKLKNTNVMSNIADNLSANISEENYQKLKKIMYL